MVTESPPVSPERGGDDLDDPENDGDFGDLCSRFGQTISVRRRHAISSGGAFGRRQERAAGTE